MTIEFFGTSPWPSTSTGPESSAELATWAVSSRCEPQSVSSPPEKSRICRQCIGSVMFGVYGWNGAGPSHIGPVQFRRHGSTGCSIG